MGGQAGEPAKIKVEVTGAEESKSFLQQILDTVKKLGSTGKELAEGPFKKMWESFKEGRDHGHSLAGAFNALKSAGSSWIGILTASIGIYAAYKTAAMAAAEKTVEMYKSVRQLQATAGGTIEEVQGLQNAFTLMGVPAETLTIAMFRLGAAIESNSQSLRRLGISVRDEAGNLREPIAVFEELRKKLSESSSEAERSAMLRQVLGRQGARLAPVFKANEEVFQQYIARGKELAAIDEEMAASSMKVLQSEGELTLQQKKLTANFGELVGMPVKLWWDDMKAGVYGYINAIFDLPESVKAARKVADELEAQAKKLGVGPMSPEQLKEKEAAMKHDADLDNIRNKAAADAAAETAKITTGLASAGVQARIDANAQELENENAHYEARIGLLRNFFKKQTDEEFRSNKEVLTLVNAHEKKVLELEIAGQKERRKLREDEVKEALQLGERQIKQEQTVAGLRTKMIEEEAAAEEASISKAGEVAEAEERSMSIKEDSARRTAEVRKNSLDAETAMWVRFAAMYSDNADVQIKANEKILESTTKRAEVEIDTNKKIIADRTAMVEKMRQQETEKAGIGATLEDKAIASLKKQGISQITSSTVKAEASRLMAWGEYYAKQYDLGGSLTDEQLAFAKEYQGAAGKLRSTGLGTGGYGVGRSISLAEQARGAAYGFRVSPEEMVYSGAGGPTDVAKVISEIPKQTQKALNDIKAMLAGEGVGGANLANTIKDMIVRALEFEAARQ